MVACTEYKISPDITETPGDSTTLVDTGPENCEDFPAPNTPEAALDETCLNELTPGSFDPVVEWTTENTITYTVGDAFTHPYIMPAIANLTDDNGDGLIDGDDIPDIAYTAFDDAGTANGCLHVVSGDGSAEVMSVCTFTWEGVEYGISRVGGVALGDLEGDGSPDIVSVGYDGSIVAFERDGTVKWVYSDTLTSVYSYPSLADLDADGDTDVVVGHIILDSAGVELGVGTGGTATPDSNPWPLWGSISIPVDLDGDGVMEIVAGNTIYAMDGTTLASSGLADGFCAVGDMDGDGEPEIVTTIHSSGDVYVWEPDGTVIWQVSTNSGGGGPPTIADFDGDGEPEIGVAGKWYYSVLDTDGTVMWNADITDNSSSATGSSVFDFDANGTAEVVFADEEAFYIFDGATGTVLYQDNTHVHGTAWEYPVIADVDNDGNAEIILGSTNHGGASGWNGITVIGSASASWAPSRTIWNQHAYHITNVNTDGTIPTTQQANWLTWNSFRAGGTELGPSHWLPDLLPFEPTVCLDACSQGQVGLYLRVGNGGLLDNPGSLIRLARGDGSTLLNEISGPIPSGGGAVLGPFTVTEADWGIAEFTMLVDPQDVLFECNEDNNTLDLGPWPCP
ncbi:MAG: hypothetical protein ACI8RZ_003595 [Myxococcota bacterium]|jgi:hypothetical protein